MSQRPPDARITGGMGRILLKSGRNAKRLLRGGSRSQSLGLQRPDAAGFVAMAS